MSYVFPRHSKISVPIAKSASGCYITDIKGKKYLDGSGGAAVSCLGHGDREIDEAVQKQLSKIAFAHNSFFSSEPAEELAELLIKYSPPNIDKVYFVSGGSEAMEASIKLARQYFVEQGKTKKCKIIARRQSYHGNTLGALAVGGNELRRKPFSPILFESNHIDPCYAFREKLDSESDFEYGQRSANFLEQEILKLGSETVMAFVAETVVGSTLGAVTAVEGYFKRIREICNKYQVLLILDEVMCGMGRTGNLFACEYEEISPDIVAIAKGLGGGYQPIGAMLCSKKIFDTISEGSGFFQHGHTYLGHPVACSAAKAVLNKIIQNKLPERVTLLGEQLINQLRNKFSQNPFIGDIRGRGLFIGMEFVKNRDTNEAFDASIGFHKRFKASAFNNGLICYPSGGTVDGQKGDHVLLAPPFIIEESHIDEMVLKLGKSLTDTINSIN